MMSWLISLLKPFVGAIVTEMLRAFMVNLRVERGTDPALLEEINRAVREVQSRTDLTWVEAIELASDRVMSWLRELGGDAARASTKTGDDARASITTTSRTMINSLVHLKLNEIWLKERR